VKGLKEQDIEVIGAKAEGKQGPEQKEIKAFRGYREAIRANREPIVKGQKKKDIESA